MRWPLVLALAALLSASPVRAVTARLPVPSAPYPYQFSMEVDPRGAPFRATEGPGGRPMLLLQPGTRYTITLHNPLPVRVAVNLSVDGLNTLTGDPGTPGGGAKWLIQPHSRITLTGWQISDHHAREFVVTSKQASYAKWRSDSWARDLSVNCGVIGAAFFWNSAELAAALARERRIPLAVSKPGARRAGAPEASASFDAGTGLGERVSSPVRSVAFRYDAGMYDPDAALVVFYDFDEPRVVEPVRPLEPDLWRQKQRFAPEMPRAYDRRR